MYNISTVSSVSVEVVNKIALFKKKTLIQAKLLNYVHCDLYCFLLHKYFVFICYG